MSQVQRSPDGPPACCPFCGTEDLLEFCDPAGSALCPRCGHFLLWFQDRFASPFWNAGDGIALNTRFAEDLGADSFDMLELVVDVERRFGVQIPDAKDIKTVEDLIRCIVRNRRSS